VKTNLRKGQRLALKPAQRARLLRLATDRRASRKDREWARNQLAEFASPGPQNPSKTPVTPRRRARSSGLETMLAGPRGSDVRALAGIRGNGRATPEEGRRTLLNAEGGCVSLDEACLLFRKPGMVTRRTLAAAIRRGGVIGYHRGGGQYAVPVWQFRRDGGLLPGLPDVVKALRSKVPGYGQLSPFAFFVQADPVTDGRTPLAALRDGDMKKVLDAVDARVH